MTVHESPGALAGASRRERLDTAHGVAALRAAPVQNSLACVPSRGAGELARFRVGCPPNRHLRVRHASAEGCGQVRV